MYLVGLVIFIFFLIAIASFSAGMVAFIDIPSLLVIVGLSFPIVMASGLMPDFLKGFVLMGSKTNPYSIVELKRIEQANGLAIKSFLLSGILGTLIGFVGLFSHVSNPDVVLPSMAVALITVPYSLVFVFIVLPIDAKVKAVLSTLVLGMHE